MAKRIKKSEIKGLTPVAEGYKIFNHDWTSSYGGNYCYADAKGRVKGSVHRVSDEIVKCGHGLHLCEKAIDCMGFYPMVQWSKFAKVRGYGKVARDKKSSKVAVEILEIVEILTWDEFYKACYGGSNVSGGDYVRGGNYVRGGCDVYGGNYVYGGSNVSGGRNIHGCNNVAYCDTCEGISRCILCHDYTGKLAIFNRPVSKERFDEAKQKTDDLTSGWYPEFNNAHDLYKANGSKWECVPPPAIKPKTNAQAYADMPQGLIDYITAMPEFDAVIWAAITGK